MALARCMVDEKSATAEWQAPGNEASRLLPGRRMPPNYRKGIVIEKLGVLSYTTGGG
jgi:hypothetical protein